MRNYSNIIVIHLAISSCSKVNQQSTVKLNNVIPVDRLLQ